jgi:hypothetical protein
VFDDFGHERLVFLFGILFIQDAVLLIPETDAAETILEIVTQNTIEKLVADHPDVVGKKRVVDRAATGGIFVAELGGITRMIPVVTIVRGIDRGAIFEILAADNVERVVDIFTLKKIFARAIFKIPAMDGGMRVFQKMFHSFFFRRLNSAHGFQVKFVHFFRIFLFGIRLVENMKLFIP